MSDKTDRRKFNTPPMNPNERKPDSEKSRPYQFRLNPEDNEEREIRDFIQEEMYGGKSLRAIFKDMYRAYRGKQQPISVDVQDFGELVDTVRWISEQIANGGIVQAESGGKRQKKVSAPSNIDAVLRRFNDKGASAKTMEIDEDE